MYDEMEGFVLDVARLSNSRFGWWKLVYANTSSSLASRYATLSSELTAIPTRRQHTFHWLAHCLHFPLILQYVSFALPPLSASSPLSPLLCCPLPAAMAKHHPDLIMCRKQPGIAIGRLCLKCDGKCPICDSFVRPQTLVRICDECNYGSYQGRCVICGGKGVSDAYYCQECTQLEKDRDGCPKIINLGTAKTDLFYERKSVHRTHTTLLLLLQPPHPAFDGV